jgi:2,3-bisphosphoglycerate-dependent phosphoglycerate mutase
VILLARHGESRDNVPPQRFSGSLDAPLTDRGREQARALAAVAAQARVAAVWTSRLIRARETAEIVAAALGLDAPRVDERLAESHRGRWEGRLVDDLVREEPEAWAAWRRGGAGFRFPGGESLAEHQARALAALDAVRSGPMPALVVCHGGTIRVIAAAGHPRGLDAFHDVAPRIPNATLLRLEDLSAWTSAA